MRTFNNLFKLSWTFLVAIFLTFGLAGCEGDDGSDGATGAAGSTGPTGSDGSDGADGSAGTDGLACWDVNGNGVGDVADEDINGDGVVDVSDCAPGSDSVVAAIDMAAPESCAICHDGVGGAHQAIYDGYVDASAFEMTFTGFTAPETGVGTGLFDATLNVTILKNGVPFTDFDGLDQKSFYVSDYDGVEEEHLFAFTSLNDTVTMVADGDYVITELGLSFDPTANGQVYGYIAQGVLLQHEGGTGAEIPDGSHVHLYEDVVNTGLAFGDAATYESAANASGCENCHGAPYLKHGYRAAEVDDLPDFSACKVCHNDAGNGSHIDWQYMVDDPLSWATGAAPTADYSYKRTIMNDVHMSHAMEFPYPQSIANCSTCHDGKLETVLDDSQFTAATCKSCHAVQGIDSAPGEAYYQGHRAPSLAYLWSPAGGLNDSDDLGGFHAVPITSDSETACTVCHGDPAQGYGGFPGFTAYHSGYDASIYDATGAKYAEMVANTVSIDSITRDGDLLTIGFSAPNADIVPEVLVSFYGWDSKHFLVGSHERDANAAACPSPWGAGCQMEYVPESSGGSANPLFTEEAGSLLGNWLVTLDMAALQLFKTDDLPTLIADGAIKKAEITITPELALADGAKVVLKAVGETFDLGAGTLVADYFKGDNSTVEITKCNACHDALASSFHSQTGRAGDGIEVCKNCHTTTFTGSHLEMASRSIDNYVHAIHSFQDFDIGDTFETFDPVLAKRYDQHTKHVFPNFTINNCEACHRAGKYDVPDQSQSMPGLQSASDEVATWYDLVDGLAVENTGGRNIGTVPEAVTGPAARACGGCHKARLIRDDAAGDLAALNAHTGSFGTYVENDEEDEVLFGIIDKIMSMFE
jgi:OmcA/MtrC family decaheme c-type cytochrome